MFNEGACNALKRVHLVIISLYVIKEKLKIGFLRLDGQFIHDSLDIYTQKSSHHNPTYLQ